MDLTLEKLKVMFAAAAARIAGERDYLCRLDAACGDGDHGVAINGAISAASAAVQDAADLKEAFFDAGMAAMSNSNGSTSSIYGSFFMGVSDSVASGAQSINAGEMAAAFKAGLKSMRDVVKGDVGDKTCFDSLIPAVEAMQNCGDVAQALSAAAEAAERGASGTVNLRAKFGRARNSAEASVGTLDPGAVSNAMIFAEFAKSFKGE